MIKVIKEKGEALMTANIEVTVYQQNIVKYRVLQESRSDRESVMSGLAHSSSKSGIIVRERRYSHKTEENSSIILQIT